MPEFRVSKDGIERCRVYASMYLTREEYAQLKQAVAYARKFGHGSGSLRDVLNAWLLDAYSRVCDSMEEAQRNGSGEEGRE